jgi:hypothetical protein
MKSTSLRLTIIASFVVLLTFATTIPNRGTGSRAIVFNGTNQYARVTLPNSAPWTSLGAFKIMGRLRGMSSISGYIASLGIPEVSFPFNLFQGGSGDPKRIDLYDNRDAIQDYHAPNTFTDVVFKLQYDPANSRWTLESWKADGTGYVVTTETITTTTNWNLGGHYLTIGANAYGVGPSDAHVDWWCWQQGADSLSSGNFPGAEVPTGTFLVKYTFDNDDGADSSGNGLNLTLTNSPTFENTPGGSGSAQISNINVAVNCNTSALINFNTDVAARAFVEYGTTTSYGSSTIDDPVRFYTEHAIPLTGLTANTTYHFRVNANSNGTSQSADQTFTTASSGAACPALPVQVDSRMPDMTGASNKTVKTSGGDYTSLQSAINDAATAGATRFITVDAGMSFNNIRLPAKSGTNWVIIRSANHSSLPEGRRVSPADASNMFKITTTSAGGGDESLATTGVSSYWRVIGAEVTIEDSALGDVDVNQMGGMVNVGSDVASSVNMPHHLVFDRMYVHGLPNRGTARGFYLRAGEDLAIIDSYVSEFHSTGVDSQAILAMANKRIKILNNHVEGSGENFMWGGDGLCCPGYEPSDLTYVHNYQRWLLAWKMDHADFGTFTITGVDTTANTLTSSNHKLPAGKLVRFTSTGSLPSPLASATTIANYWVCNPTTNTFQVSTTSNCSAIVDLTSGGSGTIKGGFDYVKKNLFELKTSNKTLVFGNLFENMWGPDQDTAINIKLERNSCRTFTVNTATDVVTGFGSPPAMNGQQVRLQNSGGALPAPLSDSTTYFARDISGSTFKLAATQGGAAIDISTTGSGTHRYEYALEMLQDLTFFRNHVRNAPLALVIQSSLNGNGCPVGWRPGSFYGSRISVLHNLFEIDPQIWTNDHDGSGYGQGGRALYITGMTHGSSAQGPDAYKFDHNTFINAHPPTNPDDSDFGTGGMMLILDPNVSSGTKGANFVFTNNIVGHREYGVRGDWATGTTVLNDFFTGYTWNKNMVVKNTQTHPESSLYVTNWTNAKFVNFNNGHGGNYRLALDSPGKNAGTDGSDVGADIDGLLRATTNTPAGNWPTP